MIIAGPNGAGKTTFARSFLPGEAHLARFINADLIAEGLAPFAPQTAAFKAGRLMLEEIEQSACRGESFAFETTLSGLGYLRHIAKWRAQGVSGQPVFPDAASCGDRHRQGGRTRAPGRARHSGVGHSPPLQRRTAPFQSALPGCRGRLGLIR